MNDLVPDWEDAITELLIKIKGLKFNKKYETNEIKRKELSEEIKEKRKLLASWWQRLKACRSY